ncbi:MAG: hypothetical protein GX445_06260 [Elusimicrobia bacterium]|nr:hypothetical protein [Elusimicrobiota bacterium]
MILKRWLTRQLTDKNDRKKEKDTIKDNRLDTQYFNHILFRNKFINWYRGFNTDNKIKAGYEY